MDVLDAPAVVAVAVGQAVYLQQVEAVGAGPGDVWDLRQGAGDVGLLVAHEAAGRRGGHQPAEAVEGYAGLAVFGQHAADLAVEPADCVEVADEEGEVADGEGAAAHGGGGDEEYEAGADGDGVLEDGVERLGQEGVADGVGLAAAVEAL